MVWFKRRLLAADYAPFLRKLGELRLAAASQANEFQMVSVDGKFPLEADYYISIPSEELTPHFDLFVQVDELDVPRVIDRVHLADQSMPHFRDRFKIRQR